MFILGGKSSPPTFRSLVLIDTAPSVIPFRLVRTIAKSDFWLRHVCPSVRTAALMNPASDGQILLKFWHLGTFRNSAEKVHVPSKCDKNTQHFTSVPVHIYNAPLNSSKNDKRFRQLAQRIGTHELRSVASYRKPWSSWDSVGKHCTAGQATDDNTTRRMTGHRWQYNTTHDRPQITIQYG